MSRKTRTRNHIPTTRILTATECNQLLQALRPFDSTCYQSTKRTRNHSLAVVMLETGLRVNELVHLIVDDLWFERAPVTTLIVRPEVAKGGRPREIPVSTRLLETIREMEVLIWQPHLLFGSAWAFGHGPQQQQLTTRTIERIIKAAALASIHRPVTPHMLRHTFATRILKKSNTRIVQMLLGHASIQTTQRYTHPNNQDLFEAIRNADQ